MTMFLLTADVSDRGTADPCSCQRKQTADECTEPTAVHTRRHDTPSLSCTAAVTLQHWDPIYKLSYDLS